MSDLKLKLNEGYKNFRKMLNDPLLFITIVFSIIVVAFFIIVPLYNVFLESISLDGSISLQHYIDSFRNYGNVRIIYNTILLGLMTSFISLIIGFIFSYLTVYIKIKGKKL